MKKQKRINIIIMLAKAHYDFIHALNKNCSDREMLEDQDIGYYYGFRNSLQWSLGCDAAEAIDNSARAISRDWRIKGSINMNPIDYFPPRKPELLTN